MTAVAAASPLPAVLAQQSHQLSQTQAVGPPALTPPPTPHQMCPKLALMSFLGSAACLSPQARLLQNRWVPSDCWAPIPHCEPSRHVCLPLRYEQRPGQTMTEQRAWHDRSCVTQTYCCFPIMTCMQQCEISITVSATG